MTDWTEGEWMDHDDYPSEAALRRLETWPYQDIAGALDFAAYLWHWPDFASHELRPEEAIVVHAEPGERYLRLATGGWSGNESIIAALRANRMLCAMAWCLCARGGLHIYRYPEQTPPVQTKITAPWTSDVVERLNQFQRGGHFHPFTCGQESTHDALVATPEGWVCPDCDYRQDWAHVFMAGPPITS